MLLLILLVHLCSPRLEVCYHASSHEPKKVFFGDCTFVAFIEIFYHLRNLSLVNLIA